MSRQYLEHYGFVGDDYLEHYGVKGMKWRNRRDRRTRINGFTNQRRVQSIADHMVSGGTGHFADIKRAARDINMNDDLIKKRIPVDIQATIRPFRRSNGDDFVAPVGDRQRYSVAYTDPNTGRVYRAAARVTSNKKKLIDEVRERQLANRKKRARHN